MVHGVDVTEFVLTCLLLALAISSALLAGHGLGWLAMRFSSRDSSRFGLSF